MKKILIYALSYLGITAGVATTVAVVGPAIIKTSKDVVETTNPTDVGTLPDDDADDDDWEDEEEIYEDTDVGCMIQDLMNMSYVNISDATFDITNEETSDVYTITLSNIYATLDINGLMAGDLSGLNVKGTLGVTAYGIDVSLDFVYANAYEYVSKKDMALVLEEDPYGKCVFISSSYDNELDFNPYLSGKMYTDDLFTGVNHVLDELGIELPDLDLDMDFDADEIIGKVSKMEFTDCDESIYKRGTLDLGDLFNLGMEIPVNIYCDIQGSMAEKTVKIKGAEILPIEVSGYSIGGNIALQTVSDPSFVITQPLLRDYYPDYSRVFDIFDTILALSKLRTFGVEFTFDVAAGGKHIATIGGNAILDFSNGFLGQTNLGVEMFGQKVNMTTTFKDNNVFFDVNSLFQVKINLPTSADVLNYFKEMFGNDSIGSIAELLIGFVQNEHVQKLLNGDFSEIENICTSVVRTGNEIIVSINAAAIGLGRYVKGQIVLVIDESTKLIKAIYLEGVEVFNYLEQKYYEISAFITLQVTELMEKAESIFNHYLDIVNEYADIASGYYKIAADYVELGIANFDKIYKAISEFDYKDIDACTDLFQEVLQYVGLDKFAVEVDADIATITDGVIGDTTMSVKGIIQVDTTNGFNKEHPTKTFGMKMYVDLEIEFAARKGKMYHIQAQCIEDRIYVVFNEKMKFQMTLTTISSVAYKIMGLMGYDTSMTPDEFEEANNGNFIEDVPTGDLIDKPSKDDISLESFSVESIMNAFNSAMETFNKVKYYMGAVNEYTFDQDNGYYYISIDGSYIGMEGNLNVEYQKNDETGDTVKVTDLRSGNNSVTLVGRFIDFDENIYLSTNLDDYFDFNTFEKLLDMGIATADQKYYHLTGTANVTLVGDIGLDIQLWLDDGDITARINITSIPRVDLVNCGGNEYKHDDPDHYKKVLGITRDYGYTGSMTDLSNTKGVIYIQNDMVYIERSETEVFRCGADWGGHKDTYYRRAICTLNEFLQTDFMLHYMFETILDLTSSIQASIYESIGQTSVLDMKLEDVLKSYKCEENGDTTKFTFGLDLDALSEDSSILSNEYLYLSGNSDGFNKVRFTLKLASILSIDINLALTDTVGMTREEVDQAIADFSACKYSWNETYHETASHPDK